MLSGMVEIKESRPRLLKNQESEPKLSQAYDVVAVIAAVGVLGFLGFYIY